MLSLKNPKEFRSPHNPVSSSFFLSAEWQLISNSLNGAALVYLRNSALQFAPGEFAIHITSKGTACTGSTLVLKQFSKALDPSVVNSGHLRLFQSDEFFGSLCEACYDSVKLLLSLTSQNVTTELSAAGTLSASMLPHSVPWRWSHPWMRTCTVHRSSFIAPLWSTFCVPTKACPTLNSVQEGGLVLLGIVPPSSVDPKGCLALRHIH